MKGVKGRIASVALCSAMAFTTVGNDVSMIANAEGVLQDEETILEDQEEMESEASKEEAGEQPEDVVEAEEEKKLEESEAEALDESEKDSNENSDEELKEELEKDQKVLEKEEKEEEKAEVKLIASFDFDDETSGFSGEGAKAINHGVTVEDTDLIKNVAHFDGKSDYLEVTKENGDSLLTGKDEFTVSY
ncbi:MAG: hypothetical protein IJJ59_05380, partial [Pseudobutyrivibrio sp.]|uniref:hypothetical protein n=1 Tax=Pseudobutyrivibrio sp. TaxID=2014367 RepID=UPI003B12B6BE|nr:hypothetical protein [Pseudobutyrivibrio sp.]